MTPKINLGTDNWQLEFDLGIFENNASVPGQFGDDDFLAVVVSPDGGETWTETNTIFRLDSTQVPLLPNGSKHIVLPLTRYSGDVVIGFYVTGGGLGPIAPAKVADVMIDNIEIVPSCTPRIPDTITGPVTICRNELATYSVPAVSDVTSYTWILPSGWSGSSTTNSISVTPNDESGTIRVVANKTSCGSSDTQTLDITISPLPIISPDDDLVACAGDSIMIEASSSDAYQWLKDNNPVPGAVDRSFIVTEEGNYKVIATVDACSDTSAGRKVTFNPLPEPVITNDANMLSVSEEFTDYQWYFNGEAISGEVYPSYLARDSGSYQVAVTDSNGCSATSERITVNGGSTGIDDLSLNDRQVRIYPNPVKDKITISGLAGNETIRLYDVTGKRLEFSSFSGNPKLIHLSHIPAGVYHLVITAANGQTISQKIIKQ